MIHSDPEKQRKAERNKFEKRQENNKRIKDDGNNKSLKKFI